jgi:hypothetical protein
MHNQPRALPASFPPLAKGGQGGWWPPTRRAYDSARVSELAARATERQVSSRRARQSKIVAARELSFGGGGPSVKRVVEHRGFKEDLALFAPPPRRGGHKSAQGIALGGIRQHHTSVPRKGQITLLTRAAKHGFEAAPARPGIPPAWRRGFRREARPSCLPRDVHQPGNRRRSIRVSPLLTVKFQRLVARPESSALPTAPSPSPRDRPGGIPTPRAWKRQSGRTAWPAMP